MVYNHGYFPEELNKSIFNDLWNDLMWKKHRTLSLMSHITKLILRVVMNRARGRTLQEIASEQYVFMPDQGMLRIPWTDKVSTCEVFRRAGVRRGLMQDMIRRQITFIGHVICKDELEKLVLTGYVEGTRDRGKQREPFLTYLSKHKGIQPSEMIRHAIDRDMWIQLCRT